jgi:type III restriction enzyme
MKVPLFDFQQDALDKLHTRLAQARAFASIKNPQAISFSAPTGSGKTIVMTALFEDIFFGEPGFESQPDAAILWISDMPELNEQTRLKIESKSDHIRVRQLVTIDSTFDTERLPGGHIYFINTQKLGTDKRLTRRGDTRRYTLWETLTNTAQALPDRFYVVIDEAHRGMQRATPQDDTAQSILQKFLLGSLKDGLCPMPLVIGMTATPTRFEKLLEGTLHSVHKVHIPPDDVRASGLLKDRILLHVPESGSQSEMALLAEATNRWRTMRERWADYCTTEKLEQAVRPILVIQVEDGTGSSLTRTDLAAAISTLETVLGRPLQPEEIAHTLHDQTEIPAGNLSLRRIEASRIEEDAQVNIVLFKLNLSTGWDCPRAEVMMSFRRAQDHTYIAQLLGRMVRTPLARRVERDATLNDVHLFLPHYDEQTVNDVINDLQDVEDVPPAETGTARELVTLRRRKGTQTIFDALRKIETYRVNAVRKQSALRRLMGLGRALTHDRINEAAQAQVTTQIVTWMAQHVQRLRDSGQYEGLANQLTSIDLTTIAVTGAVVAEDRPVYTIAAASADIDRRFEQAGLRLSNGLHKEYWKAKAQPDAAQGQNLDSIKVEVIVLAQDHDSMEALQEHARSEFDRLYQQHKGQMVDLTEDRRRHYERLQLSGTGLETISWPLPDTIAFRRTPQAHPFEKHLYVEDDGTFRANLGTWEKGVLEEELADLNVVAWLRNQDRKPWSFEIPYPFAGTHKSMFPDLIIVRKDGNTLRFDILEPHDPTRDDNAHKAVGLAQFAQKHWAQFMRIQLIRKKRGPDGQDHFYGLDLGDETIRAQVLPIKSNDELNRIFDKHAQPRALLT